MCRIKTALIKRNAESIYINNKDRFTSDFEANKKTLSEVATVESKKIRNVLAGQITRLVKKGD